MNTTSPSHFLGKVAQKAIIVHDGKVLLTRDVGDSKFELPGGRLDMAEDVRLGLEREMREELGVTIRARKPVFVCQTLWGRERSPHILIAYAADLLSPFEDVRPDGVEVEEMRWVHPSELDTLNVYQECVDAVRSFYEQ